MLNCFQIFIIKSIHFVKHGELNCASIWILVKEFHYCYFEILADIGQLFEGREGFSGGDALNIAFAHAKV